MFVGIWVVMVLILYFMPSCFNYDKTVGVANQIHILLVIKYFHSMLENVLHVLSNVDENLFPQQKS